MLKDETRQNLRQSEHRLIYSARLVSLSAHFQMLLMDDTETSNHIVIMEKKKGSRKIRNVVLGSI